MSVQNKQTYFIPLIAGEQTDSELPVPARAGLGNGHRAAKQWLPSRAPSPIPYPLSFSNQHTPDHVSLGAPRSR